MIKTCYTSIFKCFIIAILVGLSGCNTLSIEQMNTSVTEEINTIDVPSSWAIDTTSDAKIAQEWSSIITDTTLMELTEQALNNNRSLQASAETIVQSEALLKQAKSAFLPNLGARIFPSAITPLKNASITDSFSGALSASWEADLWGRIASNKDSVKYDKLAAEQFYTAARQALIAQVARAYIFAIESKRQKAINQRTLKDQQETLRIVKRRYELGTVSKREFVLAESDVFIAQDNLEVTSATETAAVQALQILIGEYPDGQLTLPSEYPVAASIIATGQPIDILRRRPDILRGEFLVKSAFAQENAVRKEAWPSLSISSNLNSSVGNALDLLNPADLALSLGSSLADTLFDGGLSDGRIEVAESIRRAQLKTFGQTVLDSFADVEGRLNDLRLIDLRYEYSQKASNAAAETLRLAEIQYREGTLDLIDVITFRQRSLQAERTLLTIERQKIEARIALYLALGGAVDSAPPL